jgi:hypothetical protein
MPGFLFSIGTLISDGNDYRTAPHPLMLGLRQAPDGRSLLSLVIVPASHLTL